jgi:hypothetical protein
MANELVNFNLPSPYQADLAKIAQQQKMAELLQAQSLQPTERYSYKGIEAHTPATAGLAKILQAMGGAYLQKQGLEEQKALGERYRTQSAGEANDFLSALRGTPAIPEKSVAETSFAPSGSDLTDTNIQRVPEGEPNAGNIVQPAYTIPSIAGVPADRGKALGLAMQSINPMVQGAGGAMITEMLKTPETAFGKIDAKDYTPESVRAFMVGGAKDYGILVPMRKQELAETVSPTGQPKRMPYDPYNPPKEGFVQPLGGFLGQLQGMGMLTPAMLQDQQVQKVISGFIGKESGQITPVDQQRLGIDLARLKNQGIETQYSSGQGVTAPSNVQGFSLFNQPPQQGAMGMQTGANVPAANASTQNVPRIPASTAMPSAAATPANAAVVTQSLNNKPIPQKLLDQAAVEKMKSTGANENTLRDEYNNLTKDFRVIQDAHEKIKSVAATGAGDMSLLYSFVKLLDPGSVVRESEFAAAAASGSFGERVQGAMQRVISGQRLPDTLRNDFIREADNLYTSQKRGTDRLTDSYTGIAKRMGLNPANIIVDYASKAGTAMPPVSSLVEGKTTNFDNGQSWTLQNGKPVQVK